MNMNEEELTRIYRAGTARRAQGRRECLTEETMHLAATGRLSKGERQRLLDHLTACSDCAQEYRLALSLKPWAQRAGAGETELPDAATVQRRAGWLRSQIDGWKGYLDLSRSVPILATAAMMLLTVALGVAYLELRRNNQDELSRLQAALEAKEQELSKEREQSALQSRQNEMEIASLRRDAERFLQPQINVPIFDLEPRGDLRSPQRTAPKIFEIPVGSEYFTLVLNLSGDASYRDHAVVISGLDGREIWSGKGLRKSSYNTCTLSIPRQLLPKGSYVIRIFGLQGKRSVPLQDFPFEIRYQQ